MICDTVKGAGSSTFAATSMPNDQWRYRYHSGAPSVPDYHAAHDEMVQDLKQLLAEEGLGPLDLRSADHARPAPPGGESLPERYGAVLRERAATDRRIVALDADLLCDTGLLPFATEHPNRLIECGIAEQDMVSTAGGLAAAGLLPFVHSFSCFLHSRPNEQIYNNASEGRKVVYVGSLAGIVPAGPGHSHQAAREVGALNGIPGLTVLEPLNGAEVEAAVDYCLRTPGSVYLRLSSVPVGEAVSLVPAEPLVHGRGREVRGGGRVALVGSGPVVVGQLLDTAEKLATDGLDARVVALPWLTDVDPIWLAALAHKVRHLVVVEDRYTRGGQADVVARALLELTDQALPSFLGVGLRGLPVCGTASEALHAHALDSHSLATTIAEFVRAEGHPVHP